jgi:hypothetical protein
MKRMLTGFASTCWIFGKWVDKPRNTARHQAPKKKMEALMDLKELTQTS